MAKKKTSAKRDRKDALRAAFLRKDPFPAKLQYSTDVVKLWTEWRSMHRSANLEPPPHIAPWSSQSRPIQSLQLTVQLGKKPRREKVLRRYLQKMAETLKDGMKRRGNDCQRSFQVPSLSELATNWNTSSIVFDSEDVGRSHPDNTTHDWPLRQAGQDAVKTGPLNMRQPVDPDIQPAKAQLSIVQESKMPNTKVNTKVMDPKDVLRQTFHCDQPFPAQFLRHPDCDDLCEFWRELYRQSWRAVPSHTSSSRPWTSSVTDVGAAQVGDPAIVLREIRTNQKYPAGRRPSTMSGNNSADHKDVLRAAFLRHLPFPEHFQEEPDRDGLWVFWRRLHYGARRAEPPTAPPWLLWTALLKPSDYADLARFLTLPNADTEADRHKRNLRIAVRDHRPFPDHLKTEPMCNQLWCFWRYLHRQAGRVEPPRIPPWSTASTPLENLDAVIDLVSESDTSDCEMIDVCNRDMASSKITKEDVELVSVQLPDIQHNTHVRQPEELPNAGHTEPFEQSKIPGTASDSVLDHRPTLQSAFHQNLPLPTHLQHEPDCIDLWRYWRFLHHKAGKTLPPRTAPWLTGMIPMMGDGIESAGPAPELQNTKTLEIRQTRAWVYDSQTDKALQASTEVEERNDMDLALPPSPAFDALSFMEGLVYELEQGLQK